MNPRSFSALPADVKLFIFSFFNTRTVLDTFGKVDRQHRHLLHEQKTFWIQRLDRDFGVSVYPGMNARYCYRKLTEERRMIMAYLMAEGSRINIRNPFPQQYFLHAPKKMRALRKDSHDINAALQYLPEISALDVMQQFADKYIQSDAELCLNRDELVIAYDRLFKNGKHHINLISNILSGDTIRLFDNDLLCRNAKKLLLTFSRCRAELSTKYFIARIKNEMPEINLNNHDIFNCIFHDAVKYGSHPIVCSMLENGMASDIMLYSPDNRLNSGVHALTIAINALSEFVTHQYPCFYTLNETDQIKFKEHYFDRLQGYQDILCELIKYKADPDNHQKFLTLHNRASSIGEFELMMSGHVSAISPRQVAVMKKESLLNLIDENKEQVLYKDFYLKAQEKIITFFNTIINVAQLSTNVAAEGSLKRFKPGD
jgi:hypothetical protein